MKNHATRSFWVPGTPSESGNLANAVIPPAVGLGLVLLALLFSASLKAQQLVGKSPRAEVTLNGIWSYVLNQSQNSIPTSGWIQTRIPATPLDDGTASVWYERTLNVPNTWTKKGRRFFLELEKAGHYSAIYINGTFIGEHYGQFSPFEEDITSALIPGQANKVDIYVHKADTTYVRPGVNVNQSSCPQNNPDCMGNAYRGAADTLLERNWVGLVGDVTFYWRPTENVSDVFVISSVRNLTLTADLTVANGNAGTTAARAAVLDGKTVVLRLPDQPVVSGAVTLEAPWKNPILWGPSPYGQPKLYTLETELLESGKVVDTIFTRFGFREVWDDGTMTYLNGKPLWMVGDWFLKLAAGRYINDRRAQAFQIHVWESTGLNMLESHWDDAGRPLLDVADEMGYLVVAAFYCDGPKGQSQVDSPEGWTDWMASTSGEWATELRHHPSVIIWRPTDRLSTGVTQAYAWPRINAAVRAADPSNRPIADGTDIDTWVENFDPDPPNCDTPAGLLQKLSTETKPLFTREIFGNQNLACVPSFFDAYYGASYTGGATGMLSELAYIANPTFAPSWFSISGKGNRTTTPITLPNWITQQFTPTPLGTEFAGLYEQYFQPALLNTSPTSGEFQLSGLPSDVQSAFLISADGNASATGVVAADDGSGTAWFVVPQAGNYKLNYTTGGVDVVQNVTVTSPRPF